MSQLRTYGLQCTVEPEVTPVTLAEARTNSRIDGDCYDTELTLQIEAATRWIQEQTEAALITSTWRWTFDQFPRNRRWLDLPMWPVQSIESIEYRDASDAWVEVTAGDIVLRSNNGRARIALAGWDAWPSAKYTPDAVRIDFVAGFGDADTDVPAVWKQAVLLLSSHWFENRQAAQSGPEAREVPFGLMAIIETLRDPNEAEDFDLE